MLKMLKKLFTKNEVSIGIVSVGYHGRHWHW